MDSSILIFMAVGFIAQIIDGALGMAYGVISTTFLLSAGILPAAASASVHTAEVFTTGVSGLSHLKLGNVDKKLFKRLLVSGVLGGVLGAYVLTSMSEKSIKPFVAFYLLLMGLLILHKAFRKIQERKIEERLFPLGLAGGFLDAVGGGGWGPIVTSTLVAKGNNPRFTIGSVNLAEFFVTIAESAAFFTLIGISHWKIIIGLILGGVFAAPLAAHACKKLPTQKLMIMVGALITLLSLRTIYQTLS